MGSLRKGTGDPTVRRGGGSTRITDSNKRKPKERSTLAPETSKTPRGRPSYLKSMPSGPASKGKGKWDDEPTRSPHKPDSPSTRSSKPKYFSNSTGKPKVTTDSSSKPKYFSNSTGKPKVTTKTKDFNAKKAPKKAKPIQMKTINNRRGR